MRKLWIILLSALILFCGCDEEKRVEKQVLRRFTVKGVDVSSYQENIDWEVLSENGISFAFIKATEGSEHKDRRFYENIEKIQKTDIVAGAYHFMSFESEGKKQAENFISTVDPDMIDLPPVIDLELYGKYNDNPPDYETVEKILGEMLSELTEAYGKKPIIYTNLSTYYLYVAGVFDEYDIWMCDLKDEPKLLGEADWTFWQYSHAGKLSGYSGGEKHIDMNVFCGSEEEFREYIGK